MSKECAAPCHGKVEKGQFFTRANPFGHARFKAWAKGAGLPDVAVLLEPFAGAGHLLRHLADEGLLGMHTAFDIEPQADGIVQRDTIADFPENFDVVVTNPPYLARNSAARRGLSFPEGARHDDLYKEAIARCLDNAGHVAAIIPASFLTSGLFRERLEAVVCLGAGLFDDTEHPVCLAMWGPGRGRGDVFLGEELLGTLADLEAMRPRPQRRHSMAFNAPDGAIGLRGIDGTLGASIRFVRGGEIDGVSSASRSNTRIALDATFSAEQVDLIMAAANRILGTLRAGTGDVLLTAFKGIRKDGLLRRRLDYALARDILDVAISEVSATDAAGSEELRMAA
ncbi:Putative type I restriction-modification system methyltransferase subunit (plasmid) [Magnetospirillum sp. XM-1]|uniref:Eco57I restriction-modification methylase domain-containing protein n=1 Tax=unclassified Magnetospirillum TaxID=2617991 RepID=UPI00073DF9FE|nr:MULTISPECIES: SAM-dependent methyltransferase [unclassified Magnetospirillum]ARJ66091.1 hypothetical protein WV31_10675 [Magnetospirillum sp. ME-1]CUW41918.1 Putative type I restriction-modification system methyltransferase subunit [Magnetospirillum sp. XM-1]